MNEKVENDSTLFNFELLSVYYPNLLMSDCFTNFRDFKQVFNGMKERQTCYLKIVLSKGFKFLRLFTPAQFCIEVLFC